MPQYYCHRCLRSFDIDSTAPVACTRCHGEFVELVDRTAMLAAAMPGGFQALNHISEMIRNGFSQGLRQQQQGQQQGQQQPQGQQQQAQQQQPQQAPNDANAPPRAAAAGDGGAGGGPTLEEFFRNMFRPEQRDEVPNLTFSFQMPNGIGVQFHAQRVDGAPQMGGNDGDRADFETVMQDIMAQMQGEGGALQRGFTEAEIHQYLPMKKVTQEHIDNGSQCTTCFDTFNLGEDVGALDCNHIFHRPCIEPWLVTKNSCPVCRQKVNMSDWKRKHQRKEQEAVLDDLD